MEWYLFKRSYHTPRRSWKTKPQGIFHRLCRSLWSFSLKDSCWCDLTVMNPNVIFLIFKFEFIKGDCDGLRFSGMPIPASNNDRQGVGSCNSHVEDLLWQMVYEGMAIPRRSRLYLSNHVFCWINYSWPDLDSILLILCRQRSKGCVCVCV